MYSPSQNSLASYDNDTADPAPLIIIDDVEEHFPLQYSQQQESQSNWEGLSDSTWTFKSKEENIETDFAKHCIQRLNLALQIPKISTEQQICCVCLDTFDGYLETLCGHIICITCIENMVEHYSSSWYPFTLVCPVCRFEPVNNTNTVVKIFKPLVLQENGAKCADQNIH